MIQRNYCMPNGLPLSGVPLGMRVLREFDSEKNCGGVVPYALAYTQLRHTPGVLSEGRTVEDVLSRLEEIGLISIEESLNKTITLKKIETKIKTKK